MSDYKDEWGPFQEPEDENRVKKLTPLDPDGEVDQILADYDIENSKVDTNQPIGKIVLRRTEIVEATKSRLTRMLREARADAIKSYKKILKEEAKLKEKS